MENWVDGEITKSVLYLVVVVLKERLENVIIQSLYMVEEIVKVKNFNKMRVITKSVQVNFIHLSSSSKFSRGNPWSFICNTCQFFNFHYF